MASTMRATVCGTKVSAAQRASVRPAKVAVCASLRQEVAKIAQVAGVSVASLALALSANAETVVKMGADNGALVFDPAEITVANGETIKWVNNAGFPHFIEFEDAIPAEPSAALDAAGTKGFNSPGETFELKVTKTGEFEYSCPPHAGAGMVGKIIVK